MFACQVSPVDSAKLSWAEELECNWTKAVVRDDLLALRDFFKQGMQIAVMEEVVSAEIMCLRSRALMSESTVKLGVL